MVGRVASYARDRYLTEKENEISPHGRDSFVTFNPILLKSGAQRVYELYRQGKLPMKKNMGWKFLSLETGTRGSEGGLCLCFKSFAITSMGGCRRSRTCLS